MNFQKLDRKKKIGARGFTLIEILIVVLVLGILAMVIIPQITVSTEDAKESTMQTSLVAMRNAIELYFHQHNNIYPGENSNAGAATVDMGVAAVAFGEQLTQYTEADGTVSTTKTAAAEFGPYIKGAAVPLNPHDSSNTVTCGSSGDITITTVDTTKGGWYYYPKTGKILPNNP